MKSELSSPILQSDEVAALRELYPELDETAISLLKTPKKTQQAQKVSVPSSTTF